MKRATVFPLPALLFLGLCMSGPAGADAPGRIEVYARWEEVKKTVTGQFSTSEAAALQKRLQRPISSYASRPLHSAYRDDPAFINVGGGSELLGGLVELVTPHLSRGETARVRSFFDSLNSGKLVQGWSLSRNYTGCLLVSFELIVTENEKYAVRSVHAPSGLPGCERPRADFKGVTFSMSTGVTALPEGPDESGNIDRPTIIP